MSQSDRSDQKVFLHPPLQNLLTSKSKSDVSPAQNKPLSLRSKETLLPLSHAQAALAKAKLLESHFIIILTPLSSF